MAPESTGDELHGEVKTVTIKIFTSHEIAGIAAANLEAHGIACWINSDDCGGWYSNLTAANGVRLLVRASDAETAIALLDAQASAVEMNQIEMDAIASTPPKPIPLNKLALWQILLGIVIGVISCLLYQSISNFGTKTYYNYFHGKADEKWVYHNGRPFEHFMDRNHDGIWDYWAYCDAMGVSARIEYDNNFDGKPDETWTYSNGVLVSMESDTDFNGIPDEFCTYKDEIIQEADMKPNGSKFVTVREIFKNGVLTEILRGGDISGNFKEVVKYDPFFNPVPTGYNPISTNILNALPLPMPSK